MFQNKNKNLLWLTVIILFSFLGAFSIGGYIENWDIITGYAVKPAVKDSIKLNVVEYRRLLPDGDLHKKFLMVLGELEKVDTLELKTKEERMAFWINVYNIGAVKMIVDHYPLKSIRDKSRLFKSVWDQEIINVGGKMFTLGHIEHNILRPMGDPRIHFAIVCASLSCPDIRAEAYNPEYLDQQLEDQTRWFLVNQTKGVLEKPGRKLEVSKIFKWYEEDFQKAAGGILPFIRRYIDLPDYPKLEFMSYNWSLNERF